MPTITTRLTSWYVLISGAIIVAVAVGLYRAYEGQRRASIDADLEDYAGLLISGVGGETADIIDIFDELLEANKRPGTRFQPHRFVLTSKDSIVFESHVLLSGDSLREVLGSDELAPAASMFKTVSMRETEYRIYAKHVDLGKGRDFHLIVVTSLERLHQSLSELRRTLLLTIPLSLLFTGLAGWFMARRALKPVRELTTTAAAISSSNLDRRVPVGRSQDELSHLARTFNEMIARLDATFKSQQQFIADASHDLRTPLTVLQMELELLMLSGRHEDRTRAALERSLIEIERLTTLADDLLFLARADAGQLRSEPVRFRIDELVVECIGQIRAIAERKNIAMHFDVDEPVEIRADETMVRRMIINLLDNAMKYSPEASTVTVGLAVVDSRVRLSVSDQGPGIPAESLPLIFQRFHRADSSRTSAGSGLGLAIVKTIVDEHHGSIGVESTPGRGSTFTVMLPL